MKRRRLLSSLALAAGAPAFAAATAAPEAVQLAVGRFAALPGTTSCLVSAAGPGGVWQAAHEPDRVLFVGSALKTFILAQALRDFETGRLDPAAQWAVDDAVRSLVSPAFANLSGTTSPAVVLEAMITHSDNMATDIALRQVGTDRVRALVAEAGLLNTHLPDSTRRLFSYLAGAAYGEDLGWAGMLRAQAGAPAGPVRAVVNERESMLSSASDMVRWYERALAGAFFAKPESLTEFQRIQSMADAIAVVVPPEVKAYAKGGSIDWDGFQCLCVAGQMEAPRGRVTFCMTVNWQGKDEDWPGVHDRVRVALVETLWGAARA